MTEHPATMRQIAEGPHTAEVVKVLAKEIPVQTALDSIKAKAKSIIEQCIDPNVSSTAIANDGLLYGLIQSGKTSILTVAAAMAADNGFHIILILTSNIDVLYDQTLERIKRALRGLTVLGKDDWKDVNRFNRQLRSVPIVIVCSKNPNKLRSLLNAFKTAKPNKRTLFLIDDEADHASLNTFESKGGDQKSRINELITDFRLYFTTNSYLQVTATPQALFLQRPDHYYRPSFTVLSDPGAGYIGGEEFFGDNDDRLKYVDLDEVDQFNKTNQPSPTAQIPAGMRRAILTFLVAATSEIILGKDEGYAFLCHVSIKKIAHDMIVNVIDRFKESTINVLSNSTSPGYVKLIKELKLAFDDLQSTADELANFEEIIEKLKFYLPGANIKLINATSNEEIKLDSAYNIFVGGNKLGRGVTIKNLLVSYYGRNPKNPNADTVLQHARMYGYRKKTLGIIRLFLPGKLAEHFRLIHQMEGALRELVTKHPQGKFEGIYISPPLRATRKNVLDPNAIGMYIGGKSYNPSYPLRTKDSVKNTEWLDRQLEKYTDEDSFHVVTIDFLISLLGKCEIDPKYGSHIWNKKTIKAALETIKKIQGSDKAYLVVKRGRSLNEPRRETQGILSGGEDGIAPRNFTTLFLYRQNKGSRGKEAVWWPQLRFIDGSYALAFSFER